MAGVRRKRGINMDQTEIIWKEFHDKLLAFIKSKVHDPFSAEDILQDVFVKIISHLDTFEGRGKIESWIYRITRNTIVDHYRNNKKHIISPDVLINFQISSIEKMQAELASCLIPMIRQLPDKYRIAIQLSEIEGKTQKEIAIQENLTLSGAKSRVQRGRVLLKKVLQKNCQLEENSKNQITDMSPVKKKCLMH